jgi:hypothetical protein
MQRRLHVEGGGKTVSAEEISEASLKRKKTRDYGSDFS